MNDLIRYTFAALVAVTTTSIVGTVIGALMVQRLRTVQERRYG